MRRKIRFTVCFEAIMAAYPNEAGYTAEEWHNRAINGFKVLSEDSACAKGAILTSDVVKQRYSDVYGYVDVDEPKNAVGIMEKISHGWLNTVLVTSLIVISMMVAAKVYETSLHRIAVVCQEGC